MECGFNTGEKIKECTEECRYFETCTRNPHRNKKEGGNGDNGKEWMDKTS